MKKIVYYIRSFVCTALCVAGISFGFINSEMMSDLLASGLDLKVNPDMTGGTVAKDFVNEFSQSNDIIRYTVYNPVFNAKWQQHCDYWQLEQTYDMEIKNLDKLSVCLTNDDTKNQYILDITDGESILYDSMENPLCTCETYIKDGGKKIRVRIPLEKKELQEFYTAKNTTHDISINGKSQHAFTVKMKNSSESESIKESIDKIKSAYNELQKSVKMNYKPRVDNELDVAYFHFIKGELEDAEKIYKSVIDREPENATALAYYGSCIAMEAGKSNPMKAMKLVKDSYTYLDKAVALAQGTENELDVLINRAEVSVSVPNSIFKKSESGAEDFKKCTELFIKKTQGAIMSDEDKLFLSYLYIQTAQCYLNVNKEFEARREIIKAENI